MSINKCVNQLLEQTPISYRIKQFNQSANVSINLFLTHYKRGLIALSSNNNQLVMLINNCVDQPCLHLLQKGTSLSSPNNQPLMLINNCVNQPLLDSTGSRLLSPSSCNKQSAGNINQQLCQLTLSPLITKGNLFLFPVPTINCNINQQLCQLTSS